MTFGERINKIRNEKGMTQDELAHAVGYKSRSTIAKIESGERDVSQSMVIKFAKALNTTTAVLMGNDNDDNKAVQSPVPSDDDIKFALFDGSEGVTDEMYDEVKRFAKYIKEQKDKK
ncbi:helix-turn-helix transcriptional regulator [uncultured Ruminococcus sp.]|uniref:helix-turn-helix domain-containing protein n=1 Tax=uncultured Ruminococcus sp. TaxID=165186 RepID=UPI0025DF651C|nr:helix-turn-helix transcriptional regulator [uncultured Ruminococcus sp.]